MKHELAACLARAVRAVADRPDDLGAVRASVKDVATLAASAGTVALAVVDGALTVDAAPLPVPSDESAFLAARFTAYGIEELTLTPRAAAADLTDLLRLLGAAPAGADPAAHFAARSSVIDARGIPRRLKARAATAVDELPTAPAAPPRARSRTPAIPEKSAVPAPFATGAMPRNATPAVGVPSSAPVADAPRQEEGDLLREAMPLPVTGDPRLAAVFMEFEDVKDISTLRAAIENLAIHADLAFRTGKDEVLIEALTGLVSFEFTEVEKDPSDERRQAFTHGVRKLARPVLLRHLAVLRHRLAREETSVTRLQAILHRFGTDAAEALIDEYASASTIEARTTCLAALRGLRRTFDALLALTRAPNAPGVTQAAAILGALGGRRAEEMLAELLHHPEARARRAAVAAFAQLGGEATNDAFRVALGDESATVRARAVAAIAATRSPQGVALLAPLLDREPEREVLFAAVTALGVLGGPEAVALLIRSAEGNGEHPLKRTPALRIQACTALVAIRTPTAMACVQGLSGDRDREVRDAAVRLVAQAQRRSTMSQPVIAGP